jgi:hypothetical protein
LIKLDAHVVVNKVLKNRGMRKRTEKRAADAADRGFPNFSGRRGGARRRIRGEAVTFAIFGRARRISRKPNEISQLDAYALKCAD